MKKITFLFLLFSGITSLHAQVFYTEGFDGTACAAGSGCDPSIVSWTRVSQGAEGANANRWYVSDTESGVLPPGCGVGGTGNQTLHVGNVSTSTAAFLFCPGGDCGAAYDDSGPGEVTNSRVESPVINCTGQSNITVDFNYIENGQGASDDCSFWYFDGATWANIDPIAKSSLCGAQGQWTAVTTISLPASADNNPNVRIGFLWINNGDGIAADPSVAIDDITLTNNVVGCDATITQAGPFCVNAASTTLTAAQAGGTWTGTGITNGTTGDFDPATAGVGNHVITYTLGCGDVDTMTIAINPLPNSGVDGAIALCATDPATDLFLQLGGTPDLGGTWSPAMTSGTGVFDPATDLAGTYTYTVTNSCGSSGNDVVVTITASPSPGTNGVAQLCANAAPVNLFDSLNGTPSAGGTWSPVLTSGTGVFDPAVDAAAPYTYSVTECAGNPQTADVVVTVIALPNSGIDGALGICPTDPATDLFLQLGGTPDLGGTWSPALTSGTGVFDPATDLGGTYTYTVTNSCGSSGNDVVVTITASPSPGTNGVAQLCANAAPVNLFDSLNGTPSAGGTWSPVLTSGTGIFDPAVDAAATYTYSVTDCAGNPQTADVVVTVNALPTVTANSTNTVICSGDQITLTGGGATSYTWDNGAVDGVPFIPAATTTYTVTGTNANGCSNTDQILITVNSCSVPPVANLSASSTMACVNDCINFTDLSSGGTPTAWSWYFFGATTSTSSNQNPTNICYDTTGTFDVALTVSNAFGQDSIFLSNYITVDSCNTTPTALIIPNVFSPNGDGQNDLFNVTGDFTTIHMEVYNRWGELMFISDQLNEGWNGRTTAGAECAEGTYFYIIDTDIELYKGSLTLIR